MICQMPKQTATLAIAALWTLATPAHAQPTEVAAVTIFPGITFAGEGGLTLTTGPNDQPVATFWRPIQFDDDGKPLAGRMDCRAAAWLDHYRPVLFNGAAVYAEQLAQGRLDGFSELARKTTQTPQINQFDVSGRRSNPRRYEVLSFIAVRTGEHLVSIRRTCSFLRDGTIYRQDWLSLPDRYTRFIIDLPPPATAAPAQAFSLDTLTDNPE